MTIDKAGISFVFVLAWKFRPLSIDSINCGCVSSMVPSFCLCTPKSSTLNFFDEILISSTTFFSYFSIGLNMMQLSMYTKSDTFPMSYKHGSNLLSTIPILYMPSCKYLFHTLPTCFWPYRFLMSLRTCTFFVIPFLNFYLSGKFMYSSPWQACLGTPI